MIDTFKKAGLSPGYVARLLNISRVSASFWFNEHSRPHKLIARRVDRLIKAIESALNIGDLPLPEDYPRREKFAEISRIIYKHLAQLNLDSISD